MVFNMGLLPLRFFYVFIVSSETRTSQSLKLSTVCSVLPYLVLIIKLWLYLPPHSRVTFLCCIYQIMNLVLIQIFSVWHTVIAAMRCTTLRFKCLFHWIFYVSKEAYSLLEVKTNPNCSALIIFKRSPLWNNVRSITLTKKRCGASEKNQF